MLLYNDIECCWECSECGGLFSAEEVARLFDYQASEIEEQKEYISKGIPVAGHCMDCGALWTELKEKPF